MQIVEMKSAAVYEKWWRCYNEYADNHSSSTNDVKTFMNWLCTVKQSKEFAPTTIICAGSCVNSKMKLNFDVNFMDHVLVKDIIKRLQRNRHQNKPLCLQWNVDEGSASSNDKNCHLHELFIREL